MDVFRSLGGHWTSGSTCTRQNMMLLWRVIYIISLPLYLHFYLIVFEALRDWSEPDLLESQVLLPLFALHFYSILSNFTLFSFKLVPLWICFPPPRAANFGRKFEKREKWLYKAWESSLWCWEFISSFWVLFYFLGNRGEMWWGCWCWLCLLPLMEWVDMVVWF